MSEAREADVIEEVRRFLSQVDGVERFVASREGLPVIFSESMSVEEAEAFTALAVDLTEASRRTLEDLGIRGLRSVSVELEGGAAISVTQAGDMLLAVQGRKGPLDVALSQVVRKILGEGIRCPYCGADLTLELVKCPRCKRKVPFGADSCPYCGADLRFKKCPKCKKLISSDGRKVVVVRDPSAKMLAALDGVLGGIIGVILGYLGFNSIPAALALGAVLGGLLGYGIYSMAPGVYKAVEDSGKKEGK